MLKMAMSNKKARKTFGSKEGTPKDNRKDKAMAKKRGMSMAAWENSAADKKHDGKKKLRKFATGGFMGLMGQPSTYDPTSGRPPSMGDFSGIFAAGQYNQAKKAYLDNMKQKQQQMNAENAKRVAQAKDGYASTLMKRALNEAYASGDTADEDGNVLAGTGYIGALKNAMNAPGGSRAFQQEARDKAFAAMQNMQEFKDNGMADYDWSKQGVTMPTNTAATPAPAATTAPAATSPAANIVGQRSPQQAAQAAQPTQEDAMLGGIGALGGMGKKGPLPNNKVAPAQPTGQGQDKYLQNYIGGVGGKGSLPSNKMAAPQNQQMKPNRMMRSGGPVKKMASGGAVTRGNGCASRGLTKGRMR